jgi:hypothetical protein
VIHARVVIANVDLVPRLEVITLCCYVSNYRCPFSTRPMGRPKARFFGPTRARAQHDFLARHEHEPSTIFSGLGWHEHDVRLGWASFSADSAGPARHEISRPDGARWAGTMVHGPTSPTGPTSSTYKGALLSTKP